MKLDPKQQELQKVRINKYNEFRMGLKKADQDQKQDSQVSISDNTRQNTPYNHKMDVQHTTKSEEVDTLPITSLSLILVGVDLSTPTFPLAIIEDIKTGRQNVFEVGAFVVPGTKIARITDKIVTLDNAGILEQLPFGGGSNENVILASDTQQSSQVKKLDQLSDNVYIYEGNLVHLLSKTEADRLLHGTEIIDIALGPSEKFYPEERNGKSIGVRYVSQDDFEPFNKAGIQSNDVIKTINGKDTHSIKDLFSLAPTISSGWLDIELERNGEDLSFSVTFDN